MDIFSLLSYINKVSLLAFFVTTAVVGYQIYIIRKEKTKASKPSIPDFRDMTKSGRPLNYTQLPDVLTKKETQKANYSNLIFSVISMLTVIVIVFIIFIIRRNNTPSAVNQATTPINSQKQNNGVSSNQLALNNVSPTVPILTVTPMQSPTPSVMPTPSTDPSLSITPSLSTTPMMTPMPSPTEIILAYPSITGEVTGQITGTPVLSNLQSLPVTGSISKGLVLFGTAITTIILSFWL